MMDYQLIYLAQEEHKHRIERALNGDRYVERFPLGIDAALSHGIKQFRNALDNVAQLLVRYQGQRAPIGRRIAANKG